MLISYGNECYLKRGKSARPQAESGGVCTHDSTGTGQMIYKGRFKLLIAFNFISSGISGGSAGRLNRINPQKCQKNGIAHCTYTRRFTRCCSKKYQTKLKVIPTIQVWHFIKTCWGEFFWPLAFFGIRFILLVLFTSCMDIPHNHSNSVHLSWPTPL